jgi:RNA polymerase sigma-70 factor (ECF subfamily)
MSIGADDGVDPPIANDAWAHVDLLYREHSGALRRRLRARLGSTEEANEILHDAFARLLGTRSLHTVREPRAYLNRILRNLLVDRSRRRSTRPAHVALDPEHDRPMPPEQSHAIEYEQMRDRYRQLVASLPPRMRQVFEMHRIEELSYREIAERLDITVRTVEWHIAEAIVRLSKGLDRE